MEYIFLEDCAADGCYEKNIGNGKQMCKKHQEMYDSGVPFKAFYGKTVLKTEFQNKQESKANKCNIPLVSNPKGTVCPVCENSHPHLLTNGAYECEECGCNWRAN